MKKFALIGKNITYSFSPALHNAYFQKVGLDASYTLEDFQNKELNEKSWFDLLDRYDGFNVTIPFKETVLPYLDQLDPVAMAVGAVNTILVKDGKTIGYNTDYNGFLTLYEAIVRKKPKTAYILGSGGAAKVVHYALKNKGVENIFYVSRRVRQEDETALSYEAFNLRPKTDAILINATPIGSKQYEHQMPLAETSLVDFDAVIDLIYTPSETVLLKKSREMGILGINGYDMLMIQAYEAEKIWWQGRPIERSFFMNYSLD